MTSGPFSIFVCYRRSTESDIAQKLYEYLSEYCPLDRVYFDRQNQYAIGNNVENCRRLAGEAQVVLILIGNDWEKTLESNLDKIKSNTLAHDIVLEEVIASITSSGSFVVPVYINRPNPEQKKLNFSRKFPSEYKRIFTTLEHMIHMEINTSNFDSDVASLVKYIGQRWEMYGGVRAFYGHFPYEAFRRYISKSHEIVRIWNTWSNLIPQASNELFRANQNGADTQILLIYPDSPAVPMRAKDLGLDEDEFHVHLGCNICILAKLYSKLPHKDKFQVRFYESLPYQVLVQADSSILFGSYPFRGQVGNTQQIAFTTTTFQGPGMVMEEQFKLVWDSAEHAPDLNEYANNCSCIKINKDSIKRIKS